MRASSNRMPLGVDTTGTVRMAENHHIESCASCIRHRHCLWIFVVSLVVVMVFLCRCRCLHRASASRQTTGRYETCCDDLGGTSLGRHSLQPRVEVWQNFKSKESCDRESRCQVEEDVRSNMSWNVWRRREPKVRIQSTSGTSTSNITGIGIRSRRTGIHISETLR